MQYKRQTKLTTVLLAATIIAGTMIPIEGVYGAQHFQQGKQQGIEEERARNAPLMAGHAATITNLQKHRDALANPTAALAGHGAPGSLDHALTAAVLVVGGAAHGLPLGNDAEKIAALEAIDGASGAGTDDVANSAVRTALGLDPTVGNFVATKPEVTRFIKLAKTELVKTPVRKATIAELQKYANAIANPHVALAGGQPLEVVIAHEVGVGGSTAHGMGIGNPEAKAAVVRAIEMAPIHHGGGGGNALDDVAKSAIRTALGIDPEPAIFAATRAQVLAFLIVAEAPEIHNMLADLAGLADPTIVKLDAVRTRLVAGTHNATTGAGLGGAGGPGDTIEVSLARLGL